MQQRLMQPNSALHAAMLDHYDFSQFSEVVDVRGGEGEFLAALLKAYPGLCGVLFDDLDKLAGAEERLQAEGVRERCYLTAGDPFEAIPGGADAYLLFQVLENLENDRIALILRNCRRAMHRESRLLLFETLLPLRAQAALTALLHEAGLRIIRIAPIDDFVRVVECVVAETFYVKGF